MFTPPIFLCRIFIYFTCGFCRKRRPPISCMCMYGYVLTSPGRAARGGEKICYVPTYIPNWNHEKKRKRFQLIEKS